MRACVGIASAILIALTAACSGAGTANYAPEPTFRSTEAPPSTPTLTPTSAHNPTPARPERAGLLVNEPESFEGYTLYARGAVYLVDHIGRLVRAWEPRHYVGLARLLDNGNLLTSGNIEIDPRGNVVWEYPHILQHHDLLRLPNGNALFLSRVTIPREKAVSLGANPEKLPCPFLSAHRVVEVRPTGPDDGEVVWQWSALDHLVQDFDPEKPNYGASADHPELIDINFALPEACNANGIADWLHANALDYNAELDQVMITVRHFSEIWIIDHSTSAEEAAGHAGGNGGKGGDLLYRWGNPRAYQRGAAADQRLFRPHSAHWIPEGLPGAGNVLVFNNGNEFRGFRRGYSSVDEFALPAAGYGYRLDGGVYGPDEVVWSYAADPPHSMYATKWSGAQRLPNGATLITYGPGGKIFEVTREGETVWEFAPLSGENLLYRSYRYAPDHPGIQNLFAAYRAARRAATAGDLVARSVFDLYLGDGDLAYVREVCDLGDTRARFYLHIVPERAEDLPQERRESGFDNLDFDFFAHGAVFDGKCAATASMPDYPVASVRTGQFGPQGELWSAEFAVE